MGKRNKVNDERSMPSSIISLSSAAEIDETIREILNLDSHKGMFICKGNPITKQGKRAQMAKMMVLTFIPIVVLMAMTVSSLGTISRDNEMKQDMGDSIRFSTETGIVVHFLQRERDMTALHLSSMGAETRMFLKDRYPETDKALRLVSQWPATSTSTNFKTKDVFWSYLDSHRMQLDVKKTDVYKEIEFYTDTIRTFIDWMYTAIQNSRDGDQWRALVAYQLLIVSKEDMGIERTLGGVYFSKGRFDTSYDYLWYIEKHNVGISNFDMAKKFSPLVGEIFEEEMAKYTNNNFTHNIEIMRKDISRNNQTGRVPSWEMSTYWFDNMSMYIDIMFEVQLKLAKSILTTLTWSFVRDTSSKSVSIGLCVLVVIICPLVVISIRSIINDIQKYALTLAEQTKSLNRERKRTDSLMSQMLPKQLAQKLIRNEEIKPESYDEATIYLADVVGFNVTVSNCNPLQIIEILNDMYTIIDNRIQKYDVYKVESIGDAQLLVSGVPSRNGKQHVFEICTLALDLLHHVTHLDVPHLPDAKMRLRIGIHSGPVIAGVVGIYMARYCLFGDTVNLAARMESTGKPGRIHISQSSRDLLSFDKAFITTVRGQTDLQGKGSLTTYWLDQKDGLEDSWPCMPNCPSYKASVAHHGVLTDEKVYENVTTLL